MAALGSDNLANLTTAQIAAISAGGISGLTSAQINALGAGQIAALTAKQMAGLTSTQIPAFSTAKIAALTTTQIAGLNAGSISGFTTQQLAVLNTAQAEALTSAQVGTLSSEQIAQFGTDSIAVEFLAPNPNARLLVAHGTGQIFEDATVLVTPIDPRGRVGGLSEFVVYLDTRPASQLVLTKVAGLQANVANGVNRGVDPDLVAIFQGIVNDITLAVGSAGKDADREEAAQLLRQFKALARARSGNGLPNGIDAVPGSGATNPAGDWLAASGVVVSATKNTFGEPWATWNAGSKSDRIMNVRPWASRLRFASVSTRVSILASKSPEESVSA